MNRLIYLLFIVLPLTTAAQSQKEEIAIREPIDRLFKGMSEGDSAVVHSAFTDVVTMTTISKDQNNMSTIQHEAGIRGFLIAVGSPHRESWSEPIWDLKIAIDGNFAQVWASYAFYLGKKFSHCGTDAFHLFKLPSGKWKIFHLTDTRQKQGCMIPDEVSNRFK